jgi:hypothetical protein
MKNKQLLKLAFERNDTNNIGGHLGSASLLGLGGLLGFDGAKDLNNRNVAVSYGAVKEMGKGHVEPANQVKAILEEIKKENRNALSGRNFLGKLNIVDVPVVTMDGKIKQDAINELKRQRFLTGIDTGWGLFDPERNFGRGYGEYSNISNLKKRVTGDLVTQRDPFLLQKFRNFLIFQPDGRSDTTGYLASGDANRISKLRNYTMAAYGNFDPTVTDYLADGRFKYMGRAHPLVETSKLEKAFDRNTYTQFISKYLNANGHDDVTPEMFKGKKIITVSGASRGDTVGARARWVAEALQKKGLNPDDYIILGMAGGNKARESAIAHAGGKQKNIFIGGMLDGPVAFNNAINNSDLHVMGMGGSGPAESLAHGGSRLAVFDDEQVFRAKSKHRWADADLIADRGIHGYEKRLIDLLNKENKGVNKLEYSPPRNWMNKTIMDEGGSEKLLRRGLDGIREYIGLRGGHTLQSDNFDSLVTALNAPRDRLAFNAELTKGDIEAGRATFKALLKSQLLNARASAVKLGLGKVGLGGLAIGAGGLMSPLFKNTPDEFRPLFKVKPRTTPFKAASADNSSSVSGVLGGLGVAATGGLIYDTGRSFDKVRHISRPYVRAVNSYLKEYPYSMDKVDPVRIEKFLKVMDTYADNAKELSNLRVMGVPAHYITRRLPLAQVANYPVDTLKYALGLQAYIPDAKRWVIRDSAAHYKNMGLDPRQTLSREMLSHLAGEFRVHENAAKVMSGIDAQKILAASPETTLLSRFAPYLEKIRNNEIKASPFDIMSPFSYREKRMLRGLHDYQNEYNMSPAQLRQLSNRDGVKGYGLRLSALGKKIAPNTKRIGGVLGALGLGSAALSYAKA